MPARNRDPASRCLPVSAWPPADQRAWTQALATGDPIYGGTGCASHWSKATIHMRRRGYGQFLNFLSITGRLDDNQAPADRVTLDNIDAFIVWLQARVRPFTLSSRLSDILAVVSALASDHDWSWLRHKVVRASRYAFRSRELSPLGFCLRKLVQAAQAHMDAIDAQVRKRGSIKVSDAIAYRDGFLVALIALTCLRRRSVAALTLDYHVVVWSRGISIRLRAQDTKTRRPMTAELPEEFVRHATTYLQRFRPMLTKDKPTTAFFVAMGGRPLASHSLGIRFADMTQRLIGQRVWPHRVRHAAVTLMAEEAFKAYERAPAAIGHSEGGVTERHYNLATSNLAVARYQERLRKLRFGVS